MSNKGLSQNLDEFTLLYQLSNLYSEKLRTLNFFIIDKKLRSFILFLLNCSIRIDFFSHIHKMLALGYFSLKLLIIFMAIQDLPVPVA